MLVRTLVLFGLSTMSSSSSNLELAKTGCKQVNLDSNVARSLVATGSTKRATTEILKKLSQAGMLNGIVIDETNERSLKRKLTEAASGHSNVNTPYGPIVQFMELGIPGCEHLEFVNPFAFLYYLSAISAGFAEMMKSICVPGRPLRIIIYADGLEPGNPFRHDLARHLMSIYWCIADWPQYVLQRSFAWPVFSIIRTKFLNQLEGGLGRLMSMILRIFFKSKDHSFSTGVHINCPTGDYVITAIFAGFLADLVGHKEITEWKGHSGLMCCLTCSNVRNMLWGTPHGLQVNTNCHKRKKFIIRENDDVFKIVDDLHRDFMRLGKKTTAFKNKERDEGFTYTPGGLLLDKEIRDVYKPVDHCIRDWQHIVCQDGVANTHVYNLFEYGLMETCGIDIKQVQEFSQICKYPSNWGKLDESALDAKRLKKGATIASFSSTILTIVTVVMMFLEKFVKECLPDHFDAFQMLYHIVGILRMGAEDAMRHVETLKILIADHMAACVRLYGTYVKPKGHHMFHIVEGMLWVGRLLSCFVTERKHREIKQCSVNVYRHFEHTVLSDVVTQAFEQILDGHDVYTEEFLICPKEVTLSFIAFRAANRCVTRVGIISAGDLIINAVGDVGKVVKVFQRVCDDLIFLEVDAYPCVDGQVSCRSIDRQYRDFFVSKSIIDVLIWYFDSPAIIRFSVPAALLYQSV